MTPREATSSWSGIKLHPSFARDVGFHPGMRLASANHVLRGDIVIFTSGESIHYPGGYAQGAKHDRHRGSKIFAVPLPTFEEKTGNRIGWGGFRKFKGVCEVGAQVGLNGRCFLVRAGSTRSDLLCQGAHARVYRRGAHEVQQNLGRISGCVTPRYSGSAQSENRIRFIATERAIRVEIVHIGKGIRRQLAIVAVQRLWVRHQEEDIVDEGLESNLIMNRIPGRWCRLLGRDPAQVETAVGASPQLHFFPGVGPGMAVEFVQNDPAEFQFAPSAHVALDADVHHDAARLLNLADSPEFNALGEAAAEVIARTISAEVPGRNAREHKKYECADRKNHN